MKLTSDQRKMIDQIMEDQKDLFQNAIDEAAKLLAKKIDNEIIWKIMKTEFADWHEFKVPWTNKMREEDWNEICAWVLEQFGLPGERYRTHPDTDEIVFLFRDAKDYEWMVLRWA